MNFVVVAQRRAYLKLKKKRIEEVVSDFQKLYAVLVIPLRTPCI